MRRALPLLLLLLAAAPAAAQPAADPIGALLDRRDGLPEEPDNPTNRPPDPEPVLPSAPAPYAAPPPKRPQLTAPVRIEETGKSPDAPPTIRDMAYDSRLKSSFASAQGFQGPLDGGWTLAAKGVGDLYALQLVDRPDRLEGAWRDLRRKGALSGSGLLDDIRREGTELSLRISAEGAPPVTATLHGTYDGSWTGELSEGGHTKAVTLRRQLP